MSKSLDEIDKDLIGIERQYCIDVVKFFNAEFGKRLLHKELPGNRTQTLIGKQIESRLMVTHLIRSYRVEVNIYPLSDKRDNEITNVLENKSNIMRDNIRVYLETRSLEMLVIEHFI
jgi:hypothetical protein